MSKRARRAISVCLPAGLYLLASALPAGAFDVEAGRRMAEVWCSGCHIIDGDGTSDVAPGFKQVANDPTKTPGRLRAWLANPHPPMPNFNLSRTEIDDIIAYLESLRDE